MIQCLCAFPTIALFIICDALTLSIRTWTEVRHYKIILVKAPPICRLFTAPAENLRTASHADRQK